MITIFTPTYNRAHTLLRLYESLSIQTSYNFEWLIVDDGSTDDTESLIREFINRQSNFEIIYIKQENSGKHNAINTGVKYAKGDYFFIVDSDDFLTTNAIELIEQATAMIVDNERYCGIVALKIYNNGKVVGSNKAILEIDTDFLSYRTKYNIKGDRAEIVKTSVMKEFSFPVFHDEKFCTEAVVWNRIAQKYIARYLNLPIYCCEYLEGGLTDSIKETLRKNPKGMCIYYSELYTYNIPFRMKIKAAINYWRYYFGANIKIGKRTLGMYLYFPLGWLFYCKDKYLSRL